MVFQSKAGKIIIIISYLFLILTVLKSFYFSNKSGGTDLRSRIIGARLLASGQSPYFYKWKRGDSDYFLDPNITPDWPVNTNISSPAELVIIYPISTLPYKYIRYIWTTLELLAAFLILFILYRNLSQPNLVLFFLIAVGIISTDIWMFHADRGQKYIFYTMFLAIIYALTKKQKQRYPLIAGILSGLFIFFRPFMGVLAFAYFVSGKWKMLSGWFIGLATGILVFILPFTHQWNEYFKSMDLWSQLVQGKNVYLENFPVYKIPGTIEGMTNLKIFSGFNLENLRPIPVHLDKLGIQMSFWMCCLLFCFLSGILTLLFYKRNRKPSIESVFIFAFILYFFAEISFFVPRNAYCLVEWLFPIPIIIMALQRNTIALIILFSGMLLLHNFPFYFPYQALIAELIFVFYSIRFLLRPKGAGQIAHNEL